MLYSFLNSDDLASAIKEDQLDQLVRGDQSLVGRAEATAVSRMSDYLGQRFQVVDIFPVIGEWSANNGYGPARPVAQPAGPAPQPDPVLSLYVRPEDAAPPTYTPIFERNGGGRITNYCWHAGTYYEALAESLNVEPGNAEANADWETYWREHDPRDLKVVNFCIDITMMYLYKRIAGRKIPTLRLDLYNEAKEWLELVRGSALTPDLPRAPKPADSSDTIHWGSNPQQSHRY